MLVQPVQFTTRQCSFNLKETMFIRQRQQLPVGNGAQRKRRSRVSSLADVFWELCADDMN